jgi:hypothetical protein
VATEHNVAIYGVDLGGKILLLIMYMPFIGMLLILERRKRILGKSRFMV